MIIRRTCANYIIASTRHQRTNEVRVASLTHGRAARGREQRAAGEGRGAATVRTPATAALSGEERRAREEGLLTATVWTCGGQHKKLEMVTSLIPPFIFLTLVLFSPFDYSLMLASFFFV